MRYAQEAARVVLTRLISAPGADIAGTRRAMFDVLSLRYQTRTSAVPARRTLRAEKRAACVPRVACAKYEHARAITRYAQCAAAMRLKERKRVCHDRC